MICCHLFPCTRRLGLHRFICFALLASSISFCLLYLSLEEPELMPQDVIYSVERNVPTPLRIQFDNEFPHQILVNGIYEPIIREDPASFLSPLSIETRLTFPINVPSVCKKNSISTLMSVHSAVTNFNRRSKMRKSHQGQYALKRNNNVSLIFFLGIPSQSLSSNLTEVQRKVEKESDEYGDIVQINIEDTYRNIVQKAIGALHWITYHCTHSKFILKMDDDIRLNMPLSIATLERNKKEHSDFILGERRVDRSPHRDKKSKNFVPVEEYPYSTWPPFVPGGLMGYPTSTAVKLFHQAVKTKPVWLDDVFISGICAQKLGIPVLQDDEFLYSHMVDTSAAGHNSYASYHTFILSCCCLLQITIDLLII